MAAEERIVYVLDLCEPSQLKRTGEVATWAIKTTGVVIRCHAGAPYYDGAAVALELWREPYGPLSPEEVMAVRKQVLPEIRKRVKAFAVEDWGCFHEIRLRKPGRVPPLALQGSATIADTVTVRTESL